MDIPPKRLALSCWRPKTCKNGYQVLITYIAGTVCCFWHGQPPDPPINPIEKGHLRNEIQWFDSYLSDRSFKVSCWGIQVTTSSYRGATGHSSWTTSLVYMASLGSVIQKHGFSYHCYADDTQLCLSFHPDDLTTAARISACLADISCWMKGHHWLPIAGQCIKFNALMFAYRTTSGSAPLYLNSLLQTYMPSRSLRSASERRITVPSHRGTKSLLH